VDASTAVDRYPKVTFREPNGFTTPRWWPCWSRWYNLLTRTGAPLCRPGSLLQGHAARLHDLRHTHGTLLIREGVPVKVVSERLGHANIAFSIETYQHVLPSMQADAARAFHELIANGRLPDTRTTGSSRVEDTGEHRPNPVDAATNAEGPGP
jgi:Phage integrase family